MSETKLEHEESLQIIKEMITQAKSNLSQGGSFQFLLWGWVIALANFGHYALAKLEYEMPYIVWLISIPTAIVSVVYGARMNRRKLVSGHLDKVYGHIWLAIGVGIIILLAFMYKLGFNHNPVIMILAGIGIYITGILLKFRPVIIGAVVLWIGAILAFTMNVTDQYLVAGIFIIFGYLVPGYLLKNVERG